MMSRADPERSGPGSKRRQNWEIPTQYMSTLSPLTGVIEESDVILDFGQYEGQSVESLKATDPDLYAQLVHEKENDNIAIRRNKDKSFRLYMNPLLARAN